MLSARLPDPLLEQLEELAYAYPTSDLKRAAERQSAAYRAGQPPHLSTEIDCAAYALVRLPATYAAVRAALRGWSKPVPSLLDLGSGSGAAAWAVLDHNESLDAPPPEATLVERNPLLRELGQRFQLPNARFRGGDLENLSGLAPHALVLFSYSWGELSTMAAERVLGSAWALAEDALLLVEPGTPEGTRRILNARARLIESGAALTAPCPHSLPCPVKEPDWCHFAVRVARSRAHRQLKGGELSYEDEKFSYVLASRTAAPAPAARILRHPIQHPGLIALELCTPHGLTSEKVRKVPTDRFKRARKASWGSDWELDQ